MNKNIAQLTIEQVAHLVNSVSIIADQEPPKAGVVRRNRFRNCNNEQIVMWLDPRGMLPANHLVWFINDAVDCLDLSGFVAGSGGTDSRGRHGYHPAMLVKLIAYCRATGRHSTREIEKAAKEDIPCRLLTAGQCPDHDTIANFEQQNRAALARLFEQSLNMALQANLVEMDIAAVDGSKVKANASKHKAMSLGRMKKDIAKLTKEVRKIQKALKQRQLPERQKEKLQKDLEFKTGRLSRIKENKQALEKRVADDKARAATNRKFAKRSVRSDEKAQINFTDRESRIMCKGKSFEQAYNAQIAVDKRAQIILAQTVTQEGNDKLQLVPMGRRVKENMGRLPNQFLGDSGFFSEEAVTSPELADTELFVPPGREKHYRELPPLVGRIANNISATDRMKRKLRTVAGKAIYGIRKGLVEPVFGQIKRCMRFPGFTVRGLTKAQQEWSLICALHNLLKIYRSGFQPIRVPD
jgi:transposase